MELTKSRTRDRKSISRLCFTWLVLFLVILAAFIAAVVASAVKGLITTPPNFNLAMTIVVIVWTFISFKLGRKAIKVLDEAKGIKI